MRLRALFAALFLLLLLASCDDGLSSLNEDPNNPTSVSPDLLLPYSIEQGVDNVLQPSIGLEFANLVVQHWARVSSTDPDRYIYSNGIFNFLWERSYRTVLRDYAEIEKLGRADSHVNYEAVGLILKSWGFSVVSDAYGDVPYSQALKGEEGVRFPAYDSQEAVYDSLLANLNRAANLIDPDGPSIEGDILFNGDLDRWQRFANALRLRLLLRISDRRDVSNAMQDIVTSAPLPRSNDDNAVLRYLGQQPNENPFADLPSGRREQFRISQTMVQTLKALDDPRLPVYADTTEYISPTKRVNDSLYVGTPNGQTTEQASALVAARRSRIGTFFRQPTAPGYILTYAEHLFTLAEATARGFIPGDPAQYYRQAIEASFAQHGVSAPNDYFSQSEVAYDPNRALGQIGTQKWVALYTQGLEAWLEWRRTGYPELEPAIAASNEGRIPERLLYPPDAQISNPDALKTALDRQGPDDFNTRVWWDVSANN